MFGNQRRKIVLFSMGNRDFIAEPSLAAAIDLHAQAKQTHWNVPRPGFIAIHELFDRVSSEVENYSDLVVECAGDLRSFRTFA
jgi:DNA-binding ferritin-like protein